MTDTVIATPGQKLDRDIAELRVEVERLKAAASNDWAKVKASLKKNFPHFVTWAGVAATLAHQLGVLHL